MSLRQRAETDCLRLRQQRFQAVVPVELVPGNVGRDGEGRLAAGIDVDLNRSRRVRVVRLDEGVAQDEVLEHVGNLTAEVIGPDTAVDGAARVEWRRGE